MARITALAARLAHVNVTGEDTDETLTIARQAAYFLVHAEWA